MNPDLQYAQERLGSMFRSLDIEVHLVEIMIDELVKHPVNPHAIAEAHDHLAGLSTILRKCQKTLRDRTALPGAQPRTAPPPMAPIFDEALYEDVFDDVLDDEVAAADEAGELPDTLSAGELRTGEYGFWQLLRQDPTDATRWHVRCLICRRDYNRAAAPIRDGNSSCCISCYSRYGVQIDILLNTLQPGRNPTTPKALLDAETGDFGFWTFLSVSDETDKKWIVRCNICMTEYVRSFSMLRKGQSSSCTYCSRNYRGLIHQVLAKRPKKPERDEVPKQPIVPDVPLGDFNYWRILGTADKGWKGQYLRVLCMLCEEDYVRLAHTIRHASSRCCQQCSRKYGYPAVAERLKELKQAHV